MRTRIARKLLHAALAVFCLAPGLWAQKKAGQVTRQIPPASVQRSQAAAAAARPAGAGGIVPKITPVAATDKMPIYWEDKLITGDGGRMRAQLEDGSILSLGQKSELVVREHNSRTQQSSLQLSYGQVRAQVVKLSRPDSKFEIRTNTAICGVLGTDEYVEATTPFSTLVMNLSDPNSRSQVEVRNSDARVTGMVVLNPGQATVVDQGKPPAGARQASSSEVGRAQQDTTSGDQPIATPILQVTSGTVSPGDTPTAQIEAGAQLTLDARLSMAGASSFTGFLWQIPRRGFRSDEPMLVVNTTDWAPGSYEGTLTVTTVQNRTATSRFTIVVTPSLAGRAAPDEAIQALARAYESLQVSQFLSYFDRQNYSGYASLEQTINQSFANISENRVLVRKANGTISGNTAVYQVEFEIRFLPKTSALPQSGVPGLSATASAPPRLVPMSNGIRAAATASISGNTGAVATFVTLSDLNTPMKLFVNTGTGMTYSFKDLPPGKYMITPSRNGFTFSPLSRTVDLTEAGLTGVDFTATALTQVVRETVTVQMQYIPNASWHVVNLSGPMGSAGLVGVPGVGNPDQGGGAGGGGSGNVAVADFKVTAAPQDLPPIARGGGGTPVTVTVDPLNGFKGTVNITWISASGVSLAPPNQAVTITAGAVSQTFTVSAGANAALGTSGIQFTAESGSIKKQGSNTITVYALTLSQIGPAVQLFAGGSTAQLQIKVDTAPTITTPITVSASGAGITSSTATVNGNGTATLTLTTSGPDTGATTVTVTASGTGLPSATLAVPVARDAPFTLSGGGTVSFVAGVGGPVSFAVNFAAGFTGSVVVTAPVIAGLTFSPLSVTRTSSGAATFSVTAPAPFTGSGTFTATAGSYSVSNSVNFSVTPVPAISLSVGPPSVTLVAGGAPQTISVTLTRTNYTGAVTLSVTGLPTGVSATNTDPGTGNTGSIVLQASAAASLVGNQTVTVTASGSGVSAASATFSLTVSPAPAISLGLGSSSVTLTAGGPSQTISVTLTRTNYTGAVTLSVPGLPSGVTATNTDPGTGNTGSIVLQASAAASLVGNQTITVTASGSGVSAASAAFSLTVLPAPAISLGLGISAVTLTAGGPSQTVVVAITRTNYTGAVTLSVSGLPIGVTANTTSPGTGNSGSIVLQASAGATAAFNQAITVTASGSGVSAASASITLTVTPAGGPSISLSLGTSSVTLAAGGPSQTVSVTVTRTNYTGAVTLSVTGLPTGVTAISTNPGIGNTGSVVLQAPAGATPVSNQLITITASGSGVGVASGSLSLTVTASGIALSVGTPSVTLTAGGGSQTVGVTLTRTNYTGAVTLSVSGLPAGVTATSTDPGTGNTGSIVLQASAAASLVGNQTVTVTASGSGVSAASATFSLTVAGAPAISLSLGTPSATLAAGGAAQTVSVTVTRTNYTGAVTLKVTGLPTGVTATITDPGPGNTGSIVLQASAAASLVGNQTVTVTASGSGVSAASATFSLSVAAAPAISLSLDTASVTLAAGGTSQTVGVTITRTNYTGAVTLSVTGLPTGVTATSTDPGTGDTGSIVLQASAGATLATDQPITVTASGSGVSAASATFSLSVTAAPAISLSLGSSSLTLTAGGAAQTISVALTRTNYTGAVTLSVAGLPSGVSTTSTDPSTGDTGSIVLQASAGATLATDQPITVTASGSGVSAASATFSLSVAAAPAISLSLGISSVTLTAGGSPQTVSVTITRTNYAGAVNLSVSGLPTGVTANSTSPGTGNSGSIVLQASAGATLATNQAITVTASGSGVSAASATINVTVNAAQPPPPPPPPTNSITIVSGNSQSGTVGHALANPLVVKVADPTGNPVPSVAVGFQVTAGTATLSAASVNTGTDGQAQVTVTLGTTAGTVTVTATASGIATPVTFSLTALPDAAAMIAALSGSGQSGAVGTQLASAFVVKVTDANGNAVSGVTVVFAVTAGGGTLSATSVATDASGQASTKLTLGTVAGSNNNTVTATAAGLSGSPVTFTASANAGAPAALTVVSGTPQSGTVGQVLASPLIVKVTDTYGNPLSGVAVSFQVTAGGGILGATSATTDANGQAQTTWTPGAAGTNTVAASVPSFPSIPAVTFTATAVLPPGVVSIGSGQASPGVYASVSVNINFTYLTADGVSFSVMVSPSGGGAPALTGTGNFSFTPSGGIPSPTITDTGARPDTISLSFLNVSPQLTGVMVLGQLQIKVPPTATAGQTYTIHVTGGSANLGRTISIPVQSGADGTLTVSAPAPPTGGGMVSAGSVSGAPGTSVQVPITVSLSGAAADTLSFSFAIVPGGSGLPMTTTLSFVPGAGLPTPGTLNNSTPSLISVAWLSPQLSPALSGSRALGNVVFTIPTSGVAPLQTYTLRITGSAATSSGASLSMTPGPDATLTITAPPADMQPMSRSAKAKLDIPADELTYTPSFPREGDTVKFRVRVQNRGLGDARGAELALLAQDRVIASERVDISAGRTVTVELAWKAEAAAARDLRFALRSADQPDSGQPEDNPPAVTLRLRNFAVERRGGLSSVRRERFTVDVRNEGCAGLRLLTGSQTSCGGSADIEFSAFINENGRIAVQAFANDGGLIDLGVQSLASVAAAPGAGYLPQGMLESGRTYAIKARNRYALVRIARVASSVNPRLVADERRRNDNRRRDGRVIDEDPFQGIRDTRTLDRVLDSARISIQIEYLVQEDGSVNFQ